MRRFIIIVFIFNIIALCLSASIVSAADTTLGCCEKTEKNDPHGKTYVDLTQAECEAIPSSTNNLYSVKFTANALTAPSKDKCMQKVIGTERKLGDPIFITPTVTIPGTNIIAGQGVKVEESTSTLANYIVAIFKYATGVIGIIAAIVLMVAGVLWLTAAGNQEQIGNAKTMIASGLMGLVLTLGAFVILSLVNTNLVKLKITPVKKIENITLDFGCCEKKKTVNGVAEVTADELSGDACTSLQGYDSVKFIKDWKAEANKCIDPFGCCKVQANNFQFAFIEGRTVSELCFNKVYEQACKDKQTSAVRQWSLGQYWQIADMAGQVKAGKNIFDIVGDIDTEWQRGRCQEWEECRNKTVAEQAIPSSH